jgi:hypothetical protein
LVEVSHNGLSMFHYSAGRSGWEQKMKLAVWVGFCLGHPGCGGDKAPQASPYDTGGSDDPDTASVDDSGWTGWGTSLAEAAAKRTGEASNDRAGISGRGVGASTQTVMMTFWSVQQRKGLLVRMQVRPICCSVR